MGTVPYVSFVTYGRNDGYTPGYAGRVARATSNLVAQLERNGIDSEVVFVEWNPMADRPLMLDSFDLPKKLRHVTVRAFIVPATYHQRFAGAAEAGFHAGEAANSGIRRARGRFITPKARDTFFSPEVFRMISRQDLDADTMYRIDRHDVEIVDEAMLNLDDDALINTLRALPSNPHAWIQQSRHWGLRELHTNACGDFTLMAAAYWHYLRGHVFDPSVLSLDIDSLVMHAAAALGVTECRWPIECRVYKPIHSKIHSARLQQDWRGWQLRLDRFLSDKVSEKAALWARTNFNYPKRRVRGISTVAGHSIERNFVYPASRWAKGLKPVPTQPDNWGMADVDLASRTLCSAEWDEAGREN